MYETLPEIVEIFQEFFQQLRTTLLNFTYLWFDNTLAQEMHFKIKLQIGRMLDFSDDIIL